MKPGILIFFSLCCLSCRQPEAKRQDSSPMAEAISLRMLADRFPDSAILRENLIQYYRDAGHLDSAISEALTALKYDSSRPRCWYILGTLQSEASDTTAAIATLRQSLDLGFDKANAILLGMLLAQTRDSQALNMAGLLLAPPGNAPKEGYFISGLFFRNTGDTTRAIHAFRASIRESYTFTPAYRELALTLMARQEYAEALGILNKAVTAQNGFAEGYYLSGICLEKTGKPAEALTSYETALQYDPDFEEAAAAARKLKNG